MDTLQNIMDEVPQEDEFESSPLEGLPFNADEISEYTKHQIVETLKEQTPDHYMNLIQRFLHNPQSVSPDEIQDLRSSDFIHDLTDNLDRLRYKYVEESEIKDLHLLENAVQENLNRIGQLEFEKTLLTQRTIELEKTKTECLEAIRAKYLVDLNEDFAVDLKTGLIKLKGSN